VAASDDIHPRAAPVAGMLRRCKTRLRQLYEGGSPTARRFRYALLAFDLTSLLYVVATSFLPRSALLEALDVLIGLLMLADFGARFFISNHRLRNLFNPLTWADIAAIVSFLAALVGQAFGFLRIVRTLRLLRSYHVLAQLRRDVAYFRINEEIIIAVVNLFVFLFVMTAIVYQTQHDTNRAIANYADALYFTVTALTTTGFGDITLPGTGGRLLTVAIMIFGVTLFLGLLRAVLRPHKVRFACPRCGLMRHEQDAVHCKACGQLLNIPNE
jgi:voltage-gated potassium channel